MNFCSYISLVNKNSQERLKFRDQTMFTTTTNESTKVSIKRVKYVYTRHKVALNLSEFPNFHQSGNVRGMRNVYGKNALLVRCGEWIYNVSTKPNIYYTWAH
jgi:hypothetical protein